MRSCRCRTGPTGHERSQQECAAGFGPLWARRGASSFIHQTVPVRCGRLSPEASLWSCRTRLRRRVTTVAFARAYIRLCMTDSAILLKSSNCSFVKVRGSYDSRRATAGWMRFRNRRIFSTSSLATRLGGASFWPTSEGMVTGAFSRSISFAASRSASVGRRPQAPSSVRLVAQRCPNRSGNRASAGQHSNRGATTRNTRSQRRFAGAR